jgi:hypothetical protein
LRHLTGHWGTKPRSIAVVYSHGYATIPETIRMVCLSAASRVFQNPTAVRSQSLAGDYSVTYAGEGQIRIGLTEDEKNDLLPYHVSALA